MKNFAAIDFETANHNKCSICSIGIVVVRVGVITDRFYRLVPLIEGLPLVAHWSVFDEGCLRSAHERFGMPYPNYKFYCTCIASRKKFGSSLPNHKLPTVAARCGYNLTDHHHALADAEACAVIALNIL